MAILQSTSITGSAEITGSLGITGSTYIISDDSQLKLRASSNPESVIGSLEITHDGGGVVTYKSNRPAAYASHIFQVYGNTTPKQVAIFAGNGLTGIGPLNYSELGAKLHVKGDNDLSGNYALKVTNNSDTDILTVENDGNTKVYRNLIQENTTNFVNEGITFKSAGGTYKGSLGMGLEGTAAYIGYLNFPHSANISLGSTSNTLFIRGGTTTMWYIGGHISPSTAKSDGSINAGHLGSFGFYTVGATGRMPVMKQHNRANNDNYGVKLIYQSASVEYDGITLDRYGIVSIPNNNLEVTNNITASGHISASTYYGDGSNLTGIDKPRITYLYTSSVSQAPSNAPTGYIEYSDDIVDYILVNTSSYNGVDLDGSSASNDFERFLYNEIGSILTIKKVGGSDFKSYKVVDVTTGGNSVRYDVTSFSYGVSSGSISNGDEVEFIWDKSAGIGGAYGPQEGASTKLLANFLKPGYNYLDMFFGPQSDTEFDGSPNTINTVNSSGSFDNIQYFLPAISQSADLTVNSVTGNLVGNADTATTASYALTASYAENVSPSYASVVTETTSFIIEDNSYVGKYVICNSATAFEVELEPELIWTPNIGDEIYFFQSGSGQVDLVSLGVTFQSPGGFTATRAQYSTIAIKYLGNDNWAVMGDLG